MSRKHLLWKIYLPFVIVVFISLGGFAWYSSKALREFATEETERELTARVRLIEDRYTAFLWEGDYAAIQKACSAEGAESGTRITVLLPSGMVIGDSMEDPAKMENHASRPEVRDAVDAGEGFAARYSVTTGRRMMYAAVPLRKNGSIVGILRASLAETDVESVVRAVRVRFLLAAGLISLFAAAAALFLSRRMTRPIVALTAGAKQIARGEFDVKLPAGGADELGSLATAMNTMARQLDDRIRTVLQQKNERDSILSAMVEGVVAIDSDARILSLNAAAASMFHVDTETVVGWRLQETVRNSDLQRFAALALSGDDVVEGSIVLRDRGERFMQAHGSALRDSDGNRIGAAIVLHDVTRIRTLERVRQDFVANVSHELKTPVTSIKGFVETLLDGALDNREDAERFLRIALRQADRLQAIIEDLLSLSRIEQEGQSGTIETREAAVKGVLESAVQTCEPRMRERNVAVRIECEADIRARMNAELLEQALVNFLANAITYSAPGSEVILTARKENGNTRLSVQDFGVGIEQRHLPRLFERFYRVDTARSRAIGGTGLGLAIVKHIAQAHGGRVEVESIPGVGSTFSIIL